MTYIPREEVQKTAFGELQVEQKTPQVQVKFPYDLVHPDIAQKLTNGTGSSVTVTNSVADVVCEGAANKFSQIRSLDTLRYGPGQGAEFLGTCAFTTGVANSSQVFGPGDDDEGFFFGYNGVDFGIMRRYGGSLEIKSLTITAGATNAGTITVTMDDTAVPIEVEAGDSIQEVVRKIVAEEQTATGFYNAGRGWETHTDDDNSVEFISLVAENATGTFSFTDTDSTGVTSSGFTTRVTGAVPTETWVLQDNFNLDKVDGTGSSGLTLDPTKINVYGIQFQYLGGGDIEFLIENPVTGLMIAVHRIQYPNQATTASLLNPTLHLTLIVKTETGYSGGDLTMKTSSLAGFIQGIETSKGIRRSFSVEKEISTTESVVLILHNELDFNGKQNKVSVYPDFTSFATESSKPTTLRMYYNPDSVTGGAALTDVEANVSVMKYGTTGTSITGGQRLLTFVLPGNGGGARNLTDLEIQLRPGDRIVLTGVLASGANANVDVSYTWVERI